MSSSHGGFAVGFELISLIVMLLGIVVAILVPTEPLTYIVIMLSGFATGKLIYHQRYKHDHAKSSIAYFIVEEFPYLIMTVAFLAGYLLGAYRVSRQVLLILFAVSFAISYYFHYKKIFVYK